MESGHLLAHIKVVQQTRELVAAIRKFTTSETCAKAFDVLQRVLEGECEAGSSKPCMKLCWNCHLQGYLVKSLAQIKVQKPCGKQHYTIDWLAQEAISGLQS